MMNNYFFSLAIIGGMGSEAAAHMFQLIVNLTDASDDNEHVSTLLLNLTSIPHSHNNFIENEKFNPIESIDFMNTVLQTGKAKNVIIACNSFHEYSSYFEEKNYRFINMINETLEYTCSIRDNVVLLASAVTINKGLYKNQINTAKSENLIIPSKVQQKRVDEIIIGLKDTRNRNLINSSNDLLRLCNELHHHKIFLIACTELSLVSSILREISDYEIIDAMDIVGVKAVVNGSRKLNSKLIREKLPRYIFE